MMNATRGFCIVALTFSSVSPCFILPMYVNESVSSSYSPFNVMGLLFFVLAFIIFVLLLLMLSPSCVDTVFNSSVFPASVDGCVRGERGHPQSSDLPTGSKVPTGSHFFHINYATRIYVCFVFTMHCILHTQAHRLLGHTVAGT
ncbi:hypothetical protein NP493_179g00026 [Ridgeia piscesae]|uniref:Uncharacterized protein n=1 Tax=Ridgeia piscesae TaxID=27915 RepID=A0AAD9UF72_RIDPI|nr:hypothetical protein NP493_179g00026 [Ridgeia piscesae]